MQAAKPLFLLPISANPDGRNVRHPSIDRTTMALRQFAAHGCESVQPSAKENVMLQANEIQQRFTHIQQTIGEAEQACQSSQDAPNEIRDCIKKLSQEARQAQSVMQSNDQQRVIECVDRLEDMGDEAKRISRSLPQMPAHVEAAVSRVHAELSDLKHKLH
jgi:chromosome segregation ATPase